MAAHEGDTAAAARARELGELLLKEHGCLARARALRPAVVRGSAEAEFLGR